MKLLVAAVLAAGCTSAHHEPLLGDAQTADAAALDQCAVGHADKIKFTRATGCANDGGVEFCIPDNDATLKAAVTNISPAIHCAAGGGRAMCSATPGLLLCSYTTEFPDECTAQYGAMTDQTWSNVCQISNYDQVAQIVQTILE